MRNIITLVIAAMLAIVACDPVALADPPPCKGWKKNDPGCQTTTTTTQPTTTTTQPPTTTTTTSTTSTTSTTTTSTPPTTQPPTTTTTTTTTTSLPPSTSTTIPSGNDQTAQVLAALSDGYEYINQTYIINSPLIPPAGATIEFGPNGKFLRTAEVDGTRILPIVDLRNGNNTLINPFIQGPNTGRYSRTINGVTYYYAHEGTGIGGVDPNMEENTGIRFSGGDTYYIVNPRIDSVWGDGITIGGQSSNIVIDNPFITFTGRSIISNLDSKNVTINGGYGTGAFWWGINMETIGSRSVNGFDVNGLEIYYTRFQPIFADGTYFNCMVYNVSIRTNLTAEYYDPSYAGFQSLRDQAVKLDPCVQSNISVQINW